MGSFQESVGKKTGLDGEITRKGCWQKDSRYINRITRGACASKLGVQLDIDSTWDTSDGHLIGGLLKLQLLVFDKLACLVIGDEFVVLTSLMVLSWTGQDWHIGLTANLLIDLISARVACIGGDFHARFDLSDTSDDTRDGKQSAHMFRANHSQRNGLLCGLWNEENVKQAGHSCWNEVARICSRACRLIGIVCIVGSGKVLSLQLGLSEMFLTLAASFSESVDSIGRAMCGESRGRVDGAELIDDFIGSFRKELFISAGISDDFLVKQGGDASGIGGGEVGGVQTPFVNVVNIDDEGVAGAGVDFIDLIHVLEGGTCGEIIVCEAAEELLEPLTDDGVVQGGGGVEVIWLGRAGAGGGRSSKGSHNLQGGLGMR